MNKALLLSAAALAGSLTAHAQDKATLDLLVTKGVITRAEADQILAGADKKPKATVQAIDTAASKVTLNGFIQGRYTVIDQHEKKSSAADPTNTNGFGVRRALLAFNAYLKDGWSISLTPEFDGPQGAAGISTFYLHRAGVLHTSNSGVMFAGLKHVTFGYEEFNLPTTYEVVDRSAASMLMASNNFAGRHIGLFWDGKIKDTGFSYGVAATNASINSYAPNRVNNEPALWAHAEYVFTCPVTGAKATAGINTGYVADLGTYTATANNENLNTTLGGGSILGFDPYLILAGDKATFRAELLGWIANGENGAEDYAPLGYNLTATYKLTDTVEPVVRFSQLKTTGIGVTDAGAIFSAENLTTAAGAPTTYYDDVWSLYTGVNYYIQGNNLKLQFGYDFSQLTNSNNGSQIDAHALRVQLQAAF